ncbi:MAG TPA: hypothetical protein VKB88_43955 [Bryobacteraceae bacterium]|nr:hypothetical protein [Bryobacteraceae bacterium]
MKLALVLFVSTAAWAADQAALERGRKEEGTCVACHSVRLVHSQRLSRAAWNKELDKMAGWGAKYSDRDALLEYLVANYGDDKPAGKPEMSADGRGKR